MALWVCTRLIQRLDDDRVHWQPTKSASWYSSAAENFFPISDLRLFCNNANKSTYICGIHNTTTAVKNRVCDRKPPQQTHVSPPIIHQIHIPVIRRRDRGKVQVAFFLPPGFQGLGPFGVGGLLVAGVDGGGGSLWIERSDIVRKGRDRPSNSRPKPTEDVEVFGPFAKVRDTLDLLEDEV
jgi:hypothetical protein